MPRKSSVTIKDVARKAGVSIATVSYAFNNADSISDETRQRVFAAAAALGYRPNVRARNLRTQESRILGYSWHPLPKDHWHPVLDRFIYGMAEAAEAEGYHILTFAGSTGDDVWSPYEELLTSGRVDGFILSDTNENDPRIRCLLDRGFPFVAFGRANEAWDFPYVDVDGETGIYKAVKHLFDLGHRRVGILAWPEDSLTGEYRYAGYKRAYKEAGLVADPQWTVRCLNAVDESATAIETLMHLPPDRRPTGVVTMSDMIALGVINKLYAMGLQPGKDVAIVGFDDIPTAQYIHPSLSSVRQPIKAVSHLAVEMLLSLIRGEKLKRRQVLLEPDLIVRASSGVSIG